MWGRKGGGEKGIRGGALDEFVIEPIKTTIGFHKQVLNDPAFLRGKFSTDFVERLFEKT